MHLPALANLPSDLGQLRMARVAVAWSMGDHRIGRRDVLKGMALVAGLSPGRLSTFVTPFSLARQAITGRRFATVIAIFCQTPFQLVQAFCQLGDLLARLC